MNINRKKVYFLLSAEAYLEPISGDRINEMNVIRAMLEYYDVYYNGVLVSKDDKVFGDKERIIHIPKEGEYDLIYIRANRDVFLKSPSPKLWFASPYYEDCFEQADGIVCMTMPWKLALETYNKEKVDYFCNTYPEEMPPPKKCILFPQVIDDSHFVENKASERVVKKTKPLIENITNFFKKNKLNQKVIRHFGPIRPSNYPYQVIEALNDKKIASKVRAESIGAGKKLALPKQIINVSRVPQEQVSEMLRSASAIWYNQDASGHIAGSLKVLEAMAVGVPIILPRYDARVDELGEEYPFFWDLDDESTIKDEVQDDFKKKLMEIINLTPEKRSKLEKYLKKRAKRHSKESVALILKSELESFWEYYND
ncbi:glycosyltransferase [Marinomonas primoryensis]|uniref:Glycosyltransferase n=1 Tax=Marinomonas primoryensis TaxID=178399 RepID=A0A859D3Z1_9GAMM|nr:glycosyltransferase [Marinomonas primoryensis]QKK81970.1 glycosyltransferase [Marinomonas primoryensis]